MLVRRSRMSGTDRAVWKGRIGEVEVTDRPAIRIIFAPLVDATVDLITTEDRVCSCGGGVGASDAPGLFTLQHWRAIRIASVGLWLVASSHRSVWRVDLMHSVAYLRPEFTSVNFVREGPPPRYHCRDSSVSSRVMNSINAGRASGEAGSPPGAVTARARSSAGRIAAGSVTRSVTTPRPSATCR
jgi:hypothetical protein